MKRPKIPRRVFAFAVFFSLNGAFARAEAPGAGGLLEGEKPVFTQDLFSDPEAKSGDGGELRATPEKGHEWSEIEIAKGIVQLNAKRYDQARGHFEAALEKDARNFVAREYLAAVFEAQGDWNAAVEQLVRAKHVSPPQRYGVLNFRIGFLYFRIGHAERARVYLKLAIAGKNFAAHANYLLAQLDRKEKDDVSAERHLHAALESANRPGSRSSERELLQAIFYYLGESYARLGYFDSAALCLERAEPGGSWEIRNAAWRLHSEINAPRASAGVGLFGQYDSNVIDLPKGTVLPQDVSNQAGASSVLTGFGEWRSARYRAWSGGAGAEIHLKNHLAPSLAAFDVLSFHFDAALSRYSGGAWRFGAKYGADEMLADRARWRTFQTLHGPELSMEYFPDQRWKWGAGSYYRFSDFGRDPDSGPDRRSGRVFGAYLSAGIEAPNPRLLPSFRYQFEHAFAFGENFISDTHTLSAGVDWRVFERTRMGFSAGFSLARFPSSANARSDLLRIESLDLMHWFEPHLAGVIDVSVRQNDSNAAEFRYNRAAVAAGLTYRL